MGFTSKYDGIDRIELGDGYWVDVKRCLTVAESNDAERALVSYDLSVVGGANGTASGQTKTNVRIDPEARLFEMVLASIEAWNLDDDDPEHEGQSIPWDLSYDRDLEKAARRKGLPGDKWKSPLRKNLERMPRPAYDLISTHVTKSNEAPAAGSKEAAQFRSGNGVSPQLGLDEAPDDSQVLAGAGLSLDDGLEGGPEAP